MDQDTFAGRGKREPMLMSELLEELGVAQHDIPDQILAVLEWWQQHGETARPMLRVAVERWMKDPNGQLGLWRRRPGSIDGEDFVRSLGFDDVADEIAEIKRRRRRRD